MNVDYAENLPEWLNEKEMDLVLSDDIDSLASCALLTKVKGWNIKYFYDFERAYASKALAKELKTKGKINNKCWVDVAVQNGYAIDNHLSRFKYDEIWNEDMININTYGDACNDYYTFKYSGSTLLEVWSILDYPLPKTEVGKMILLAIDSSFKGFYNQKFADVQYEYLVDTLGLDDLYDVIWRHKSYEFYNVMKKYKLNSKIEYDNGLKTDMDLSVIGKLLGVEITLPTDEFFVYKEFEVIEDDVSEWDDIYTYRNAFSLALTYKNKVRYSKEKEAA